MSLDHQTVEAHIHSLLREGRNQLTTTAHMARIAEDRQLGQTAAQLDGNMPLRSVAVDRLIVLAKSTVNSSQAGNARIIQALQCSDPQLEVGVYGVLDQHGHIVTLQRIGNLLHRKGVCRRACSNPENIDLRSQSSLDVLLGGHLNRSQHTQLALHTLEPLEARLTTALEASRLGAGLPHSGTENLHAIGSQTAGCLHYLLLGLGTARTRYNYRALRLYALE